MTEIKEAEALPAAPEAEPAEEARSDGLKFTLEEVPHSAIRIKVIGIGGCGGNIVDYMIANGVAGVEFACVNTDEQALKSSRAPVKLCMGQRVTQGYGTGSSPDVGREAALENTEEISELLGDADMVYITLGLGGGTGTGAGPVIASLAKQMGALTVAAAVKPFSFEGKRRAQTAADGLETLLEQVDTVIVIPNERLLDQAEAGSGFFDSFLVANAIATETLVGITDIISKKGVMNTDFADVKAVLQEAGPAFVGASERGGRDSAMQAARDAISCPVMEHGGLARATKVLVNITGSSQFGMHDASEAIQLIQREIATDADLTVGVVRDDSMGEVVRVMMIASGFAKDSLPRISRGREMSHKPRFDERQPAWQSEGVADLLGSEHGAPEASAARHAPVAPAQVPQASPPRVETQPPAAPESAPPASAPNRNPDAAEGQSGRSPFEFMPPPNIRARDEPDEEDQTAEKPAFFRRRSIFR